MTTDPNASSPDSPSPKPARRIKIGSQRPDDPGVPPNQDSKQPVLVPRPPKPFAPTSTVTKTVDTERVPSDAASPVGAEAPETEDTAVEPIAAPVAEAVELDPATMLQSVDDDLEREIAMAMGEGVDELMAGQMKSSAGEPTITVDEKYLGTVVKVHRDTALFELPGQHNGVVPLRQFEENPEVGSEMEVIVTGFSADDQLYELIVPGASVAVADWGDLAEGVVVEAKITGHNKGGLECEVNHIRGFIPASQISLYRVEDFASFVDDKLTCVVTEANPDRRNLVLSHRAILEREKAEAREKTLQELEVGQTREGTVTRLHNFGAFVDLGGIDGLIHISQLSWDNIRHPSEVVEEGQRVRVRIEKIDPNTNKIGLAYRDLMHHPWEGIDTKYEVGTIAKGTVSKIMDFGAFVRLEAGVEGLVHISELSHKRVNRVSHVVEEGQSVEVKVLSIDPESQRISLSMKQTVQPPEGQDSDQSDDDGDQPKHQPKRSTESLKGGVNRASGGDQFGLNW